MGNKIQRLFNPTEEERLEDERKWAALRQQLIDDRDCVTCEYYLPPPRDLPGFVSVYGECKMDRWPLETCLFYQLSKDYCSLMPKPTDVGLFQ